MKHYSLFDSCRSDVQEARVEGDGVDDGFVT